MPSKSWRTKLGTQAGGASEGGPERFPSLALQAWVLTQSLPGRSPMRLALTKPAARRWAAAAVLTTLAAVCLVGGRLGSGQGPGPDGRPARTPGSRTARPPRSPEEIPKFDQTLRGLYER